MKYQSPNIEVITIQLEENILSASTPIKEASSEQLAKALRDRGYKVTAERKEQIPLIPPPLPTKKFK